LAPPNNEKISFLAPPLRRGGRWQRRRARRQQRQRHRRGPPRGPVHIEGAGAAPAGAHDRRLEEILLIDCCRVPM